MIANYHTHSRWCRHGKGELEDFVQEAIHHGLKEIAFTEHVPHREGFSWLPWEEFPMYDHALNEVKERFKRFNKQQRSGLWKLQFYNG